MTNIDELLERLQCDIQQVQMITRNNKVKKAANLMMAALNLAYDSNNRRGRNTHQCFEDIKTEFESLKSLMEQIGAV
jgi:hypothetical protein